MSSNSAPNMDVIKGFVSSSYDVLQYPIVQHVEWNFSSIVGTIVATGIVFYFFFNRGITTRVKRLEEVGYEILEDDVKGDERGRIHRIRDYINSKDNGNPPPVYPNGWFAIMRSQNLAPGEVKAVSALSEDFAVMRTNSGEARVMDAFCPHLGANFGSGGRVVDNCLECPFHGWLFSTETGACTAVPYSKQEPPSVAKVKRWHSIEANGSIYVWYHAENEEPSWFPPFHDGVSGGSWALKGYSEHVVNCHIQEIPENGADIAHLQKLHEASYLKGSDLRYVFPRKWLFDFLTHQFGAEWKQTEEKHVGVTYLTHTLKLFGYDLYSFSMQAKQIGPSIVHMELNSIFGSSVLIQNLVPIKPLQIKIMQSFYAPWYFSDIIAGIFVKGEFIMIERDMMIWNHKRYASKPVLVKEDALINRHRRWYSQFYTENSPRLQDIRNKQDIHDW